MKAVCRTVAFLALVQAVPIAGQWQAAAYVGKAVTANTTLRISPAAGAVVLVFKDFQFEDRSFQTPLYYGLRGGYMIGPRIGVEGEFIHVKVFGRVEDLPPALQVQQYNVSHGLNLLLANFVFRRVLTDRFDLALRGGIGIGIPHPEIRMLGEALEKYQIRGAAFQTSGGIEFKLASRLLWLGEYKFTGTNPRFELRSSRIENRFLTHHFVTGLGIRF
jgi:hypothetical protein